MNQASKLPLREALQQQVIIADGAMGTYLYQSGYPTGISYEEFNVTKPDVIETAHRTYYQAGSRLIETNTFAANRKKLAPFGLAEQMAEINRAGVAIARRAVGDDAYVVGAIGAAGQDTLEQIEILLEAGVDGILFESFSRFDELLSALQHTRALSDVAIICQFALANDEHTLDGVHLAHAFSQLKQAGADCVGLNCRRGPGGILSALDKLSGKSFGPLSVFPNAGMAAYVDGRYVYETTPAYFAEKALSFVQAGVRIYGGCCGTTPEHIAAIASAIQDLRFPIAEVPTQTYVTYDVQIQEVKSDIPEQLGENQSIVDLVAQRYTVICELDPPRDLDISRFMKGAEALQMAGVDALTMADNSLAMTRMSNLAVGQLVKQQFAVRPLLHIACRDRNLIGTQSHLMGLHALGINHVLAVTGDPAKFGDLPGSKNVYELTSFEVIRLIKQLNDGYAFSGKQMKQKANFVIGAAFNPNVRYLEKAIERLERKIASGADYVMTQPIYDPRIVERLAELTKHISIPIFVGIMPLANGRNAEYLHHEVPGIELSEEVRKRMAGLEGEEGRRVGTDIARELLDVTMQHFRGIYLITPFLNYEMSVHLTAHVHAHTKK